MTDAQPERPIRCRGVRGAITVEANTAEAILAATHELLTALVNANGVEPDDISAVWFTTTTDLDAAYPAVAARQLGWTDAALMCAHEMSVPGGLPKCVVLICGIPPHGAQSSCLPPGRGRAAPGTSGPDDPIVSLSARREAA